MVSFSFVWDGITRLVSAFLGLTSRPKRSVSHAIVVVVLTFLTLPLNAQEVVIIEGGSTSTWTVPAGVTSFTVECWGSGGGGGSYEAGVNTGQGAGGGGGGAYSRTTVSATSQGTVYTYTIPGMTPSWTDGGDTEFRRQSDNTLVCRAAGGKRGTRCFGVATGRNGGDGGADWASFGDLKYSGGRGGNGVSTSCRGGGGGSGAGSTGPGNAGSNSNSNGGATVPDFGGAGPNGGTGNNAGANASVNFGGGGAGARRCTSGSANLAGGQGMKGGIRITYTVSVPCEPSTQTTVQAACGSYTWAVNGQTYTESGLYAVTDGCLTQQLDLTVTPSTTETSQQSACGSYTWAVNGQNYTESGLYAVTDGCLTQQLDLTIGDDVPPVAICQDITVALGSDGTALLDASSVDNGSFDDCGEVSLSMEGSSAFLMFGCADIGSQTITLTVTDGSGNTGTCTATVVVDAGSAPQPTAFFNSAADGLTVSFTNNSTDADTYQWDFDGLGSSGDESPVFTFPTDGIYEVCLSALSDCGTGQFCSQVSVSSIVTSVRADEAVYLTAHPNPGEAIVHITGVRTFGDALVTVIDLSGRSVLSQRVDGGNDRFMLDISGLAKGAYTVHLTDASASRAVRLIKE